MSNKPTPDQPAADPLSSTISPAKRKRLQQCFERASELAHKDKPDFDYAHDLFVQCVANDPGNLVYVEALLDNLQRKYKNNKKGSRLRSFGGKKTFTKAVAAKDWPEVFREGLVILQNNPWDVPTLRAMAEACAANHYNEAELRYLKNALDGKPKDPDVNRHCARSLARMGQFDQAIACWHRVEELTKDEEPAKMISELTLAKTMGVTPSEAVTGVRLSAHPPVPKAKEATPEPPPQTDKEASDPDGSSEKDGQSARREIKLNPRQLLERAIRDNPTEVQNYVKLAELHSADRRYQEAEKVLFNALEASGNSLKVRSLWEDARIRSSKARLAIAEKRATSEKTDEARELAAKLKAELNRLELDIYAERSQRHPDNLRFRYELGVRLRRAGNYREAIKFYQDARKETQCYVAATLEMGECLQQLKQYAKALQCYQSAIQKSSDVDGDRRKMALYRGGVLAAALNQNELAERYLADLLQLAPDFKDASARLDKLAQIRHKG